MGPLQPVLEPVSSNHSFDDVPQRVPWRLQLITLVVVVTPFLGLIAAMVMLWGWGFDWLYFWLLTAMYMVTGHGVTIGFHRYFTHRSFETNRAVKIALAVFGSMSVQGPLLKWAAIHRKHHHHSDEPTDPHSPHLHGHGFSGLVRGLWHAHMGWLFEADGPDLHRYIPDLREDRALRAISDTFFLWAIAGVVIPAIIGGVVTMSWTGALLGFIWGGLVRLLLVDHVTWSINSVCHVWGAQHFRSHDHSRNNVIFGVLGLGEGWHNNHHAFPTSARHGLLWWQFDSSWLIIRAMAWLGLVWDVHLPAPHVMESKRRDRAAQNS